MKKTFALSLVIGFLLIIPTSHAAGGLAQLLTSSAWCTFKYSQVTGYSSSTRYTFGSNGTWKQGRRAEGGGGGAGYASQHDSGNGGRWKVIGEKFLMSEGGDELEEVSYRIKQNSNGYPIIVADGVEYSQCN